MKILPNEDNEIKYQQKYVEYLISLIMSLNKVKKCSLLNL